MNINFLSLDIKEFCAFFIDNNEKLSDNDLEIFVHKVYLFYMNSV